VVGTTASGKSSLGIELALRLNGEIVSADSRQLYRGLDIGTGKVTPAERALVPHHLLDVADVQTRFTVAEFQRLAFKCIADISARGKVPLLVGGSGLYIRAVIDSPAYPATELERTPLPELVARLQEIDPVASASIDRHNPRRVVRALEVTLATGVPFSAQRGSGARRVDALQLGLTWPRDELRRRIEARVDDRIAARPSMLDEVRGLLDAGVPAERLIELGLEYRYVTRFLVGELGYEDMLRDLKRAIYRFAKRQLTWFRRDPRIHWIQPQDLDTTMRLAQEFLGTLE
jgi:tRNA dimethylallyltransferase